MTKDLDGEPWRALPAELADVIEPELHAATEEILAAIAREVPEYARPLEGAFGAGIRTGVSEALRQFVALIRDPDAGREPGPRRLRRARTRRAAAGPHPRLAAVRLPRRRSGRVAPISAAARRRHVDPDQLGAPRRVDLRLHR